MERYRIGSFHSDCVLWQDTSPVGMFIIWTRDLGSQVKRQGTKWEKYAARILNEQNKIISHGQILCALWLANLAGQILHIMYSLYSCFLPKCLESYYQVFFTVMANTCVNLFIFLKCSWHVKWRSKGRSGKVCH